LLLTEDLKLLNKSVVLCYSLCSACAHTQTHTCTRDLWHHSIYQINLTCTEIWKQWTHNLKHVSGFLGRQHQAILVSVTSVCLELVRNVMYSHSLAQSVLLRDW